MSLTSYKKKKKIPSSSHMLLGVSLWWCHFIVFRCQSWHKNLNLISSAFPRSPPRHFTTTHCLGWSCDMTWRVSGETKTVPITYYLSPGVSSSPPRLPPVLKQILISDTGENLLSLTSLSLSLSLVTAVSHSHPRLLWLRLNSQHSGPLCYCRRCNKVQQQQRRQEREDTLNKIFN